MNMANSWPNHTSYLHFDRLGFRNDTDFWRYIANSERASCSTATIHNSEDKTEMATGMRSQGATTSLKAWEDSAFRRDFGCSCDARALVFPN